MRRISPCKKDLIPVVEEEELDLLPLPSIIFHQICFLYSDVEAPVFQRFQSILDLLRRSPSIVVFNQIVVVFLAQMQAFYPYDPSRGGVWLLSLAQSRTFCAGGNPI